jgi:hypothetical protein
MEYARNELGGGDVTWRAFATRALTPPTSPQIIAGQCQDVRLGSCLLLTRSTAFDGRGATDWSMMSLF